MIFCVEHVRMIGLDIQIGQVAEQFQYVHRKNLFLNVFEMIKEKHTYRF